MNPIEKRIDQVLEELVNDSLRAKIREQVKDTIKNEDFSEIIVPEIRYLKNEDWFTDSLKDAAQIVAKEVANEVANETYLEDILGRVEQNLQDKDIEALIVDKLNTIVRQWFSSARTRQAIDKAVYRSVQEYFECQEFSNTIDSLVKSAFQKSVDRFANDILNKSTDER